MPRRVIDVGASFSGNAKLCVLNKEVVTYIALSHCWGSNLNESPLKTLKATLPTHLEDIPLSSLSRTFRDAIAFTRKLKIRYIWIDSLCIVQDDDMDWQHEIPKMGDIYRNCWLTLSAAKSADGSGGLFTESTPGVPITFFDDGRETLFHARRVFSDSAAYPNMDEHLDMKVDRMQHDTDFPLFFRGWVMQERYLSPRTLYFCASELIWECSDKAQCECWGKP
ncbi:HET-domain-containing protein, partial [Amniculicola lignicola CBS 123094]